MVLDDIALYLQAQGLGTRGTTIFEGRLPPEPPGSGIADQILVLFSVPGLGVLHVHDDPGASVEQPVVQVRVRGSAAQGGYAAMWARATQAFTALDSVRNQTLSGTFYQAILALQSPFGFPEDQYERPFVLFNVRCLKSAV